ncbi:MAG: hypothetical protein WCP55_01765 [Lentisphaerota bacterium]
MAKGGLNLKDLAEFLNPSFALKNENFFVTNNRGLSKRGGIVKQLEIAGNKPVTLRKNWLDNDVIGYDKTVAIYNPTTGVTTSVKTNWNTNDSFSGCAYGDYFLVGNIGDKIHYISQTITYGTQTSNFTVGKTITGASSGATAIILTDVDGGATGTITLGSVVGIFITGELITDDNAVVGSATTTSGMTYAITELTNAPKSGVIVAVGARLYAGVGYKTYYSGLDDGTNPPFLNWTVTEVATDGGIVSFRNAGTVRSIASLGDTVISFGDTGKYAFRLNIQNDGTGTVVKVEQIVIDRVDMGGASGAITTPKGLFYVNSAGLWQMMSMGQSNIAFSDQEQLTSVNLGTDYFKDVDLTNCDLVYYARYSTILLTCAKASTQNNHVITYNHDMTAFSTFRNWNINRWMSRDNDIYGASSIKTALYHCFTGYADDGVSISTNYLQELKMSGTNPWSRQMLCGGYIKGLLHSLSVVRVALSIYNVRGEVENNKVVFDWTLQSNENKADGWGTAGWGTGSWGGDVDTSGLIESFDGFRQFIRNFQRIRINITESSKLPYQIDYVGLESKNKGNIRRRKLSLQS